ncbi:MAG: UV DNA damage repair endonuclease UvsE [Angelakisella sp.]
MINFGYACLALAVANTQMRSCIMRTATPEHLREIIAHNLQALMQLVQYNKENNIHLFRISSDLIPFGSSPVNTLQWQDEFADAFEEIGKAIADADLRVSMHPGQYTVINSPDEDVVNRAIADLEYHEQVLRLLKTDSTSKLILHVGGAYGDNASAIERFYRNWERLSDRVRSRIVLENDERIFNISDVLNITQHLSIPAVFDTLHHSINLPNENQPVTDWLLQCAKTWKASDGRQKVHYSQQSSDGKPGAHSNSICAEEFLRFYETVNSMDLDVMLEVKDKNLSAIKCRLMVADANNVSLLEQEWAKYKYSVLEHSPNAYLEVRELLKDKHTYSAKQFYKILEQAMDEPLEMNNAVNALLHVWGYFKNVAQPDEKKRFFSALDKYKNNTTKVTTVKNQLYNLANKYDERYLLQSYYFL